MRPVTFGLIVAGAAILGAGVLITGVGALGVGIGNGSVPRDPTVADVGWMIVGSGAAVAIGGIVALALGLRHGVDLAPLRSNRIDLGVLPDRGGGVIAATIRF